MLASAEAVGEAMEILKPYLEAANVETKGKFVIATVKGDIHDIGKNIVFEAHVQAGTYIRKLISNLGEMIGGAHMLELRRIQAGMFEEKNSITLYELEESIRNTPKDTSEKKLAKLIVPGESICNFYSVIKLKENNIKQILTGKPIHKEDLVKKENLKKGEIVCAFNKEKFIGMYEIIDSKDIYAKPKFVMQEIRN